MVLSTLVMISSACGNSASHPAVGAHAQVQQMILTPKATPAPLVQTGDFAKTIQELQNSDVTEVCDVRLYHIQKEISEALDSHKDEIQALNDKPTPPSISDSDRKSIPFGKSTLTALTTVPDKIDSGWKTTTNGWYNIYKAYLEIKDKPIDAKWLSLNSDVRGILFDDQKRLKERGNYGLDKDSGPNIEALLKTVTDCSNDKTCSRINFTDAEKQIVHDNYYYHFFQNLITRENNPSDAHDIIVLFATRLNNDDDAYRFNKTASLSYQRDSSGKNIFTLPFDGTIFDDTQRTILQNEIQDVWKSSDSQVLIKWVQAKSMPELYKLFFDVTSTGDRDKTLQGPDFEVHFYPHSLLKGIAHETGHALGFSDHYYTHWDSTECNYVVQFRDDDIMSNHETGSVTDEDWKELIKNYQK